MFSLKTTHIKFSFQANDTDKEKEFILLVLDKTKDRLEKDGSSAGLNFLTKNLDIEDRFSKFCGKFRLSI